MSLRFQADNDLKFAIVKAVRRREPAIDFVTAREAGLESVGDPELLACAARDNRVLVSHDRRTMLHHFRTPGRWETQPRFIDRFAGNANRACSGSNRPPVGGSGSSGVA